MVRKLLLWLLLAGSGAALGQPAAPLSNVAVRLDGEAGGYGDIKSVTITTTSPLTGGNACLTGPCAFTLGLGTVPVANGGSGNATTTAYSVVMTGATATGTWKVDIGPGTATQVLTSNGAGAYPTWQAASGGISGLTSTKIPVAASSTTIADSGLTWASSVLTVAGAITVTSQAAGTIGAVIKGAASQTANLIEWQNSSGTVLASISAAGVPSFPGAGTSSLRIGPSSVASGNGDVAIGNTASASSGSATALGTASTAIDRALAAGYQSSATGAVSVVLGYQATDSGGASATVVGAGATGVANATAIGRLANAASLSVAIGILSVAPGANQFVAGSSAANTAWIDNVYFGSGVTDTAPKSVTYNATGGSGANVAGANIAIAGGKGTGTAAGGKVSLYTSPSIASGSTAQTLVERVVVPAKGVALTDATAVSLFEIALPKLKMTGGKIVATVQVTDGTDMQSFTQEITYSAVNKGGTYTTSITATTGDKSVSAGTLTNTWTILNGTNKVTIQLAADTSLTPSGTNSFVVYYTVTNNSEQAITLL